MSSFSTVLRNLLHEKNIKQSDLAKLTGINKSSISEYLSNNYQPKYKNILKIAAALHVPPTALLNSSGAVQPLQKRRRLPILGQIAAGLPILAQENIEGYMPADGSTEADFCLRVKGDSMINARIYDGDIVYIKEQPTVENGEIAAVLINDGATLKRVYKLNGTVQLRAENPKYKPMTFTADNCDEFKILGKAIALYTKL